MNSIIAQQKVLTNPTIADSNLIGRLGNITLGRFKNEIHGYRLTQACYLN